MRMLQYMTCMLLLAAFSGQAADQVAPCEMARGRHLVPVRVNGSTPILMLLDLAVRHPVLDPRVAAALRLESTGGPIHGNDPLQRPVESIAVAARFEPVPGLMHDDAAVLADLSGISAWLGTEIGGLFPAHLPGYEVTLDFAGATVAWRPLPEARLEAVGGEVLAMTVAGSGAPVLTFQLNQQHLQPLRLDLSCSTSLALTQEVLETLRTPTTRVSLGFQESAAALVRLDQMASGAAVLEAPVCAVLPPEQAPRAGLPFLRRFRMTLNYEFGLCALTPLEGNQLREPAFTGFGLALHRMEHGYWRVRVVDNSPAARAGIRTGDFLVAAGGTQAGGKSYDTVAALIAGKEGEERVFVFQRADRSHEQALTAETLF